MLYKIGDIILSEVFGFILFGLTAICFMFLFSAFGIQLKPSYIKLTVLWQVASLYIWWFWLSDG